MAITFQTSFEDYDDGDSYNAAPGSLHAHGWYNNASPDFLLDTGLSTVVSGIAHTGSKSVALGSHPRVETGTYPRSSTIQRVVTASPSGRSAQIEAWGLFNDFNWDNDPVFNPRLSVSLYGYNDDTAPTIFGEFVAGFAPFDPTTFAITNSSGVLASATVTAPAGWHSVRLELTLSTITGGVVNTDGRIRAFYNGVLIHDLSGLQLDFDQDPVADGFYPIAGCYVYCEGYVDDVTLSNDETIGSPTPPDDGTSCCGDRTDPSTEPNPGEGPRFVLQPWDRLCEGGGTVPVLGDETDPEAWTL